MHDIKVEERDLVIATHGRGFYVMDDISPLRQWGVQTRPRADAVQAAGRGPPRAEPVAIDYDLG